MQFHTVYLFILPLIRPDKVPAKKGSTSRTYNKFNSALAATEDDGIDVHSSPNRTLHSIMDLSIDNTSAIYWEQIDINQSFSQQFLFNHSEAASSSNHDSALVTKNSKRINKNRNPLTFVYDDDKPRLIPVEARHFTNNTYINNSTTEWTTGERRAIHDDIGGNFMYT